MAISEPSLKDVALMTIAKINESGGLDELCVRAKIDSRHHSLGHFTLRQARASGIRSGSDDASAFACWWTRQRL